MARSRHKLLEQLVALGVPFPESVVDILPEFSDAEITPTQAKILLAGEEQGPSSAIAKKRFAYLATAPMLIEQEVCELIMWKDWAFYHTPYFFAIDPLAPAVQRLRGDQRKGAITLPCTPPEIHSWATSLDLDLPPEFVKGLKRRAKTTRWSHAEMDEDRSIVQKAARQYWAANPKMTAVAIAKTPEVAPYTRKYTGKNTIPDWLSDARVKKTNRGRSGRKK